MANGNATYSVYIVDEQDPIVGVLETAKKTRKLSNAQIAKNSKGGISAGTLSKWFTKSKKRTRRPQFATVAATAGALGITHLPITREGRRTLLTTFKE